MGIFLIFFSVCLIFLGLPASIVTTIVFKVKKKKFLVPAICIPASIFVGFVVLCIGGYLYGQTDEYKQSVVEREQSELEKLKEESKNQENYIKELENETEKIKDQEAYIKELEEKLNNVEQQNEDEADIQNYDVSSFEEQEEIQEVEKTMEEINSIFYGEIGLNEEYYKGKEILLSFKGKNSEDKEIEKITTESNLCYGSIRVEFSKPQYIDDGIYITVKGILQEEHSANVLKNAEIVAEGTKAEENYNRECEEWKNSFLQAEEVSYNDLLRYPDTYKNKKIKVNANIKEVETDGVIFNGTISGVIPGTENEIAFYDYRENREPRIQEGDKLTIYGVGNGTTTVKLKKGKGLFAETVDKYDIPNIYIQFFDFR